MALWSILQEVSRRTFESRKLAQAPGVLESSVPTKPTENRRGGISLVTAEMIPFRTGKGRSAVR